MCIVTDWEHLRSALSKDLFKNIGIIMSNDVLIL